MADVIKPVADGTWQDEVAAFRQTCVRRYYVTTTDSSFPESLKPDKGKTYHYKATGHDWPSDTIKVVRYRIRALSHPANLSAYILTVWGSTYTGAALGTTSQELSVIEKFVSDELLVITPDFLYMRRATKSDAKEGIKEPGGAICTQGEYIYKDASPSSAGAFDHLKNCPIVKQSPVTETPLTVKMIGLAFHVKVYRVRYSATVLPLNEFFGCVTAWGNDDFKPAVAGTVGTSGQWRAALQQYEVIDGPSGIEMYRITRTFKAVPLEIGIFTTPANNMRWNAQTYGTWSPDWTQS